METTKRVELVLGDCQDALKDIEDNSISSCVVDPPYGLSKEPDMREVLEHWLAGDDYKHTGKGFMGKSWDSFVPGPATWKEVYRVLKPGGYALVFGGTRTYDLLTTALRLSGFEIRDSISWIHAQGYPRPQNIAKDIDSIYGSKGKVVGKRKQQGAKFKTVQEAIDNGGFNDPNRTSYEVTEPVTKEARKWRGWNVSLKPAHELIVVARKPLSESSIARNILRWGTSALNVDACRVPVSESDRANVDGRVRVHESGARSAYSEFASDGKNKEMKLHAQGRWPTNVVFSHSEECVQSDEDVTVWECMPGCPVATLGETSRYFSQANYSDEDFWPFRYAAKPSRSERDRGCEGLPEVTLKSDSLSAGIERRNGKRDIASKTKSPLRNNHPTVKPLALIRWLVRLVTPPDGVVLDCFMGSGTTGMAAVEEGFGFVGIENDEDSFRIASARVAHAEEEYARKAKESAEALVQTQLC